MRAAMMFGAALVALGVLTFAGAGRAQASTMVLGDVLAHSCAVGAIAGDSSDFIIETCTVALETEPMLAIDVARTYVNRGVLYLKRGRFVDAAQDFKSAERRGPELGEIYLNRAYVLIAQKRYAEAVAQTTKGLALNPYQPEKGYYNRAVAEEYLGDYKAAYADFQNAVALKPDWEDAKAQAARFTVVSR